MAAKITTLLGAPLSFSIFAFRLSLRLQRRKKDQGKTDGSFNVSCFFQLDIKPPIHFGLYRRLILA